MSNYRQRNLDIGRYTIAISTNNVGDQYGHIGSTSHMLTLRLTKNPAIAKPASRPADTHART
jgi:hypothetical protein